MTLLILGSNLCAGGCHLRAHGVVGIIAFLLWYVTAGICFMVPEPRDDERSAPPQPVAVLSTIPVQLEMQAAVMVSETTTHRVEADGTTVTETIKTNSDGSTTVSTSIIPPSTVVALPSDANFGKM